ncbi:MAG: beta strand repeat-containing protein [Pyrinomonadaceae bacterium]
MKNPPTFLRANMIARLLIVLAIVCALSAQLAAQTPGGTTISNQASATYSDGTNSYSTVSNTVTVTVSNVAGLAITPDAGTNPVVVAGQTGVLYNFTVTNIGNFTDQVRFLASGASMRVVGPGTITRAVIDVDNSGTINAGDTDINANGADVLSANIAQNGTIHVLVEANINAGATAGQSVQVLLGDAATGGPSFDNQAANSSGNEVRTVSASSVNGLREARGDLSATVGNDSLLQLTLTAPAGPVNLGTDITYTWQVSNTGALNASGVTLNGSTQVYIIAPIPARTVLKSGQSFPAGTLYTTSPLSTAPLSATWGTTAPAPLSNTTRIAFPVGATLAAGASSSAVNMIVTVNTGIDASVPIDEIGDVFGKNSLSANITDQSGDATQNNGDGNADFNEGYVAGSGHGVIQRTTLTQVGAVLVGPSGAPAAVGPTDNNDDYSNKSVNTGIAGVAPGGVTTASGQLVYVNTLQNTGNANDTFTIDAPTVPAGFTVEVSTNGGTSYTTVSGGGSVTLAISFASSANINVRVTSPAGKTVLTGYDTIVRVTSGNTPAANNKTIDRLYTGFVRLDKASSVSNATGVGAATDPVPGAVITYNVTYTNVSSSDGDANCVKLTATNVVITEDGSAGANNWGTYTTNSGSPSDSGSGVVVTVNATKYTDTVASLAAGASGTFTFKRSIN